MKSFNYIELVVGQIVLVPVALSWGITLTLGTILEIRNQRVIVETTDAGFRAYYPSGVFVPKEYNPGM